MHISRPKPLHRLQAMIVLLMIWLIISSPLAYSFSCPVDHRGLEHILVADRLYGKDYNALSADQKAEVDSMVELLYSASYDSIDPDTGIADLLRRLLEKQEYEFTSEQELTDYQVFFDGLTEKIDAGDFKGAIPDARKAYDVDMAQLYADIVLYKYPEIGQELLESFVASYDMSDPKSSQELFDFVFKDIKALEASSDETSQEGSIIAIEQEMRNRLSASASSTTTATTGITSPVTGTISPSLLLSGIMKQTPLQGILQKIGGISPDQLSLLNSIISSLNSPADTSAQQEKNKAYRDRLLRKIAAGERFSSEQELVGYVAATLGMDATQLMDELDAISAIPQKPMPQVSFKGSTHELSNHIEDYFSQHPDIADSDLVQVEMEVFVIGQDGQETRHVMVIDTKRKILGSLNPGKGSMYNIISEGENLPWIVSDNINQDGDFVFYLNIKQKHDTSRVEFFKVGLGEKIRGRDETGQQIAQIPPQTTLLQGNGLMNEVYQNIGNMLRENYAGKYLVTDAVNPITVQSMLEWGAIDAQVYERQMSRYSSGVSGVTVGGYLPSQQQWEQERAEKDAGSQAAPQEQTAERPSWFASAWNKVRSVTSFSPGARVSAAITAGLVVLGLPQAVSAAVATTAGVMTDVAVGISAGSVLSVVVPVVVAIGGYILFKDLEAQVIQSVDYDSLYSDIADIVRESQSRSTWTKAAWLSHYDTIVSFIRELEKSLTPEETDYYAQYIHDIGYYEGQKQKIQDKNDPFVGGSLADIRTGIELSDQQLREFLTEDGYNAYTGRFQDIGSTKFPLSIVKKGMRQTFFDAIGKEISQADSLDDSIQIINTFAQPWNRLLLEAEKYPDVFAQKEFLRGKQKTAVASALALTRVSRSLSADELNKGTNAIWRYVGQWNGEFGFDGLDRNGNPDPEGWRKKDPLVEIPLDELSPGELAKDEPIWRAVLSAQESLEEKNRDDIVKDVFLQQEQAYHRTVDESATEPANSMSRLRAGFIRIRTLAAMSVASALALVGLNLAAPDLDAAQAPEVIVIGQSSQSSSNPISPDHTSPDLISPNLPSSQTKPQPSQPQPPQSQIPSQTVPALPSAAELKNMPMEKKMALLGETMAFSVGNIGDFPSDMDEWFLLALILTESNGIDPDYMLSHKDAAGPMQVKSIAIREIIRVLYANSKASDLGGYEAFKPVLDLTIEAKIPDENQMTAEQRAAWAKDWEDNYWPHLRQLMIEDPDAGMAFGKAYLYILDSHYGLKADMRTAAFNAGPTYVQKNGQGAAAKYVSDIKRLAKVLPVLSKTLEDHGLDGKDPRVLAELTDLMEAFEKDGRSSKDIPFTFILVHNAFDIAAFPAPSLEEAIALTRQISFYSSKNRPKYLANYVSTKHVLAKNRISASTGDMVTLASYRAFRGSELAAYVEESQSKRKQPAFTVSGKKVGITELLSLLGEGKVAKLEISLEELKSSILSGRLQVAAPLSYQTRPGSVSDMVALARNLKDSSLSGMSQTSFRDTAVALQPAVDEILSSLDGYSASGYRSFLQVMVSEGKIGSGRISVAHESGIGSAIVTENVEGQWTVRLDADSIRSLLESAPSHLREHILRSILLHEATEAAYIDSIGSFESLSDDEKEVQKKIAHLVAAAAEKRFLEEAKNSVGFSSKDLADIRSALKELNEGPTGASGNSAAQEAEDGIEQRAGRVLSTFKRPKLSFFRKYGFRALISHFKFKPSRELSESENFVVEYLKVREINYGASKVYLKFIKQNDYIFRDSLLSLLDQGFMAGIRSRTMEQIITPVDDEMTPAIQEQIISQLVENSRSRNDILRTNSLGLLTLVSMKDAVAFLDDPLMENRITAADTIARLSSYSTVDSLDIATRQKIILIAEDALPHKGYGSQIHHIFDAFAPESLVYLIEGNFPKEIRYRAAASLSSHPELILVHRAILDKTGIEATRSLVNQHSITLGMTILGNLGDPKNAGLMLSRRKRVSEDVAIKAFVKVQTPETLAYVYEYLNRDDSQPQKNGRRKISDGDKAQVFTLLARRGDAQSLDFILENIDDEKITGNRYLPEYGLLLNFKGNRKALDYLMDRINSPKRELGSGQWRVRSVLLQFGDEGLEAYFSWFEANSLLNEGYGLFGYGSESDYSHLGVLDFLTTENELGDSVLEHAIEKIQGDLPENVRRRYFSLLNAMDKEKHTHYIEKAIERLEDIDSKDDDLEHLTAKLAIKAGRSDILLKYYEGANLGAQKDLITSTIRESVSPDLQGTIRSALIRQILIAGGEQHKHLSQMRLSLTENEFNEVFGEILVLLKSSIPDEQKKEIIAYFHEMYFDDGNILYADLRMRTEFFDAIFSSHDLPLREIISHQRDAGVYYEFIVEDLLRTDMYSLARRSSEFNDFRNYDLDPEYFRYLSVEEKAQLKDKLNLIYGFDAHYIRNNYDTIKEKYGVHFALFLVLHTLRSFRTDLPEDFIAKVLSEDALMGSEKTALRIFYTVYGNQGKKMLSDDIGLDGLLDAYGYLSRIFPSLSAYEVNPLNLFIKDYIERDRLIASEESIIEELVDYVVKNSDKDNPALVNILYPVYGHDVWRRYLRSLDEETKDRLAGIMRYNVMPADGITEDSIILYPPYLLLSIDRFDIVFDALDNGDTGTKKAALRILSQAMNEAHFPTFFAGQHSRVIDRMKEEYIGKLIAMHDDYPMLHDQITLVLSGTFSDRQIMQSLDDAQYRRIVVGLADILKDKQRGHDAVILLSRLDVDRLMSVLDKEMFEDLLISLGEIQYSRERDLLIVSMAQKWVGDSIEIMIKDSHFAASFVSVMQKVGKKATPHLLYRISDDEGFGYDRMMIIKAIGQLNDRRAVPHLLMTAQDMDEDPDLRGACLNAIVSIGDQSTIPDIIRMTQSGDEAIRQKAFVALASFDWTKAGQDHIDLVMQYFISALKEGPSRNLAIGALSMIGKPAIPYLVEALKDLQTKAGAILVLVNILPKTEPRIIAKQFKINIKLARYLQQRPQSMEAVLDQSFKPLINEISYNLNREVTLHPAERRIGEDEKTSLFDYLFKKEDITAEKEIFDYYFRNDPDRYTIRISDIDALLQYMDINDLQRLIWAIRDDPKQSLDEIRDTLKNAIRDLDNADMVSRKAEWILSNLFVLQDSIDTLSPIAQQAKDGKMSVEGLRSMLLDIDKAKTIKDLVRISQDDGILIDDILRFKLNSIDPQAKETFLIDCLSSIDKTPEPKSIYGILQPEFLSLPSQTRSRVYHAVLFKQSTDNAYTLRTLQELRQGNEISGMKSSPLVKQFLAENSLVASEEVLTLFSDISRVENNNEKKESYKQLRRLFLDRQYSDKKLAEDIKSGIQAIESGIAVPSSASNQIPQVYFEPMVKITLDREVYDTFRSLIEAINEDKDLRDQTATLKNDLYEKLVLFGSLEFDKKEEVFTGIVRTVIREKGTPDVDNVQDFYSVLLYNLEQYIKVIDAYEKSKNNNFPQTVNNEVLALSERILGSISQTGMITDDDNKDLLELQDILAGLDTEILLAQFSSVLSDDQFNSVLSGYGMDSKDSLAQKLKQYARENQRFRWTDHMGRNIYGLIGLYLRTISDDEIYINLLEALINEIDGSFPDWKYESKDYMDTLEQIIELEISALPQVDRDHFDSEKQQHPDKSLSEILEGSEGYDDIKAKVNRVNGWKGTIRYETETGLRPTMAVFTDDFYTLFNIGNYQGSTACQSCTYGSSLNRGLIGYVVNGANKAVAILDEDSRVITRRIVRLRIMEDDQAKRFPAIFVEESSQFGVRDISKLYAVLSILSQKTGLPVIASTYRPTNNNDVNSGRIVDYRIILPRGRSEFDYSDLYGHSVNGMITAGLYRQIDESTTVGPYELLQKEIPEDPVSKIEKRYGLIGAIGSTQDTVSGSLAYSPAVSDAKSGSESELSDSAGAARSANSLIVAQMLYQVLPGDAIEALSQNPELEQRLAAAVIGLEDPADINSHVAIKNALSSSAENRHLQDMLASELGLSQNMIRQISQMRSRIQKVSAEDPNDFHSGLAGILVEIEKEQRGKIKDALSTQSSGIAAMVGPVDVSLIAEIAAQGSLNVIDVQAARLERLETLAQKKRIRQIISDISFDPDNSNRYVSSSSVPQVTRLLPSAGNSVRDDLRVVGEILMFRSSSGSIDGLDYSLDRLLSYGLDVDSALLALGRSYNIRQSVAANPYLSSQLIDETIDLYSGHNLETHIARGLFMIDLLYPDTATAADHGIDIDRLKAAWLIHDMGKAGKDMRRESIDDIIDLYELSYVSTDDRLAEVLDALHGQDRADVILHSVATDPGKSKPNSKQWYDIRRIKMGGFYGMHTDYFKKNIDSYYPDLDKDVVQVALGHHLAKDKLGDSENTAVLSMLATIAAIDGFEAATSRPMTEHVAGSIRVRPRLSHGQGIGYVHDSKVSDEKTKQFLTSHPAAKHNVQAFDDVIALMDTRFGAFDIERGDITDSASDGSY